MAKSLYSLLLSDDIVAAIDTLAVREGYSRSAFINHILAEYASLSTPEKRHRDILEVVERVAGRTGLRTSVSPGGALTLRTALQYRYNPAVFYVVELAEAEETLGELRVGLRTQNSTLLENLQHFFALWDNLERQNLPNPPAQNQHSSSERRYVRALRRPAAEGEDEAGRAIAAYIELFDACMKTFFNHDVDLAGAQSAAEDSYLNGLSALGDGINL